MTYRQSSMALLRGFNDNSQFSKMVNDVDKDLEQMLDEVISNREEILDIVRLQSMTGENRQNLQRSILETEREKQNLQSKIVEAERKLSDSYFNALTAVMCASEAKDKYSSGHSRRVATIAAAIAQELGLPPHRVNKIAIAGLVHDIGKIGVREGVLDKQGKLTNEEYQHLISHCEIGEHILRPIVEDEEILDMVRHHHEHYNGTGHPDGLSGKQISFPAKVFAVTDDDTHIESNLTKGKTLSQSACILAVADAYDAMMFPRSYRGALSIRKPAEEIIRGAGSQFDPDAAQALLRIADSLSSLFKAAEEKAEQEARGDRRAREADKQAEKQAKIEAKEKAKQETEKVEQAIGDTGSQIYVGDFSLLVSFADFVQLRQFKEYLEQIENLRIVLTRGSAEEDGVSEVIDVSLQNPMHLTHILDEIPIVERVDMEGAKIVVMLKNPVVS